MTESHDLFLREDAPVILGVGKNMVESIRYWCTVTRLVDESGLGKKPSGTVLKITPVAEKLLGDNGWDPYLEDDASLWLLHWLLIANPKSCTTSQIAFSWFHKPDFTKQELLGFVASFAERHSVAVKASVLLRDVDCFLRAYLPSPMKRKTTISEEGFDCPFQELGLLQSSPDKDFFRFCVGHKPTLPSQVLGYALLDYFDLAHPGRNTMSVQECLYGIGSPGQAFKLDENTLIVHLEEMEKITHGKIILDETAGLKQIYRREAVDGNSMLQCYYRGDSCQ